LKVFEKAKILVYPEFRNALLILVFLLLYQVTIYADVQPKVNCIEIEGIVDSIYANELEEDVWTREVMPFLYQQTLAQDCDGLAEILNLAGLLYYNDGSFEKSRGVLERADSLIQIDNRESNSYVRNQLFLGLIEIKAGNSDLAELHFKRAQFLSAKIDFVSGEMQALVNQSLIAHYSDNIPKSKELLQQASQLIDRSQSKAMPGYVYLNLGSNFVKEKNYKEAEANFEKARAIWDKTSFTKGLYYLESHYAIMARERGQTEIYEKYLINALELMEKDSTVTRASTYTQLGYFYVEENKIEEAIYYLERGMENYESYNENDFLSLVSNLSRLYAQRNDFDKIREVNQKVLSIYKNKFKDVSSQKSKWQKKEFVLESKIIENELLKKSQEEAAFKIRLRNFLLLLLAITFLLAGVLVNMRLKSNKLKEKLHLEQLRTKISKNLHDDVGTLLAGISYQAQTLELDESNEKSKLIENIVKKSAEAKTLMRDMVWAMDSRKDSFTDLEYKMKDFLSDMLANSAIDYQFQNNIVSEFKGLASDLKHGIYLIFKESINNIIKHSDAKNLAIRLSLENKMLSLSIKDDGSEKIIKKSGQGLQNMAERAKDLGGSYRFDFDKGYQTIVKLPIEKDI